MCNCDQPTSIPGIKARLRIEFDLDYAYNMKLLDVLKLATDISVAIREPIIRASVDYEMHKSGYGSRSETLRLTNVQVYERYHG